ncbi:hypothetical protein FY136_28505 (plasmid) [Agrobacterium tumefaciens]|uniref:hypothetical protein n=1 Tax=Agrobacterium tumefaciens TaxID=358 RepID=UPI0021CF50A7|nr:hypothetical protein [Agrobacterium tumefaciens]UXT53205.1 hypothetical protein FY136_28505 [Agrobacterium tumefaciens]
MTTAIESLRFTRMLHYKAQDYIFVEGRDGIPDGRVFIKEIDGLRDFISNVHTAVEALHLTPSSPAQVIKISAGEGRPVRCVKVKILLSRGIIPWLEVRSVAHLLPHAEEQANAA